MVKAANRALVAALGPEEASFTWTSLQLNRDTVAEPHVDEGTIGMSAIVLLGTFTGGALTVDGMDEQARSGSLPAAAGGMPQLPSQGAGTAWFGIPGPTLYVCRRQ